MVIHFLLFGCFKKLSKGEENIYKDGNEGGWTLVLPRLLFWLEKTHMEWDRASLDLGRVGDVLLILMRVNDIKITYKGKWWPWERKRRDKYFGNDNKYVLNYN